MAYTATEKAKRASVGQVEKLASLLMAQINGAVASDADALKYVSVSGSKISFWKDATHSGTADFVIDLPTEYFLDQAKTKFVANFSWSNSLYPDSADPSYNGKPVLVLAVKGQDANNNVTTTYSFVDISTLGVTNKADKVTNATNGDIATLNASGNLVDSGTLISDVVIESEVDRTVPSITTTNTVGAALQNGHYSVASHGALAGLANAIVADRATDAEFDDMLISIGLLSANAGE